MAAALESIHAVTGAVVDRSRGGSVGRLVSHLGSWLEEAATQLTNIAARSYVPHDVDIDARNADVLAAMKNAPWETVWKQATVARAYMLQRWFALRDPSEAANWRHRP
ncbi:MAG: hypothetical protein ACRDGE_10360 [Candidatus Limnocylindria bacterium]